VIPDQDKKLIDKLLSYYNDAYTAAQANHQMVDENLHYYSGYGHWTEEQRLKANQEKRPLITYNLVFRFLNALTGYQRLVRQQARAFPVGRGSDPLLADLLSLAIHSIDSETNAPYVQSDLYANAQIGDRSHIRWRVRFHGLWPKIEQIALDPRDVYEDPTAVTYDDSGHRFVIVNNWLWEEEVLTIFADTPEERELIKTQIDTRIDPKDRRFIRTVSGRRRVNVLDIQYKNYEKFIWAYRPEDGEILENLRTKRDVSEAAQAGFNVFVDSKPITYVARLTGTLLLEHKLHPFLADKGMFDITRYSPYFAMGQDVSMTHQLRSQQDEVNANRSDMRNLFGRAPKGLIFYDETSGLSETDIAHMSAVGGAYKVSDINGVKFQDTSPYYSAVAAMAQLYQMSMRELQDLVGITETLLGQLKSSTSGVVFNAARSQAAIGLQTGLDNFERTIKLHYRKLLHLMRKFFPANKLFRISRDQYGFLEKVAREQGDVQPEFAVLVNGSPAEIRLLDQYYGIIGSWPTRLEEGEFDIELRLSNADMTNQQQTFLTMLELVRNIPDIGVYILDMLIENSGLPNASIMAERVRQAQEIIKGQRGGEQELKALETLAKAVNAAGGGGQNGTAIP